MDHRNTRLPDDARTFFLDFLRQIRAHPWLKQGLIVFCPERACGLNIDYMRADMEKSGEFGQTHTIYEKGQVLPGIYTSNITKNKYAASTNEDLSHSRLRYIENFVGTTDTPNRLVLRQDLAGQMHNTAIYQLGTGASGGHPKYGWSAKQDTNGKGASSQNDDLLMAVAIGIYVKDMWITEAFKDNASVALYQSVRQQYNA